jgi:L-iditol 2-dehydrogenase
MKALILEANGVLRYKDTPQPSPALDECLIRIQYAGICNSDIQRAFNNGAYNYPLIMGHEISGTVAETGSGISKFKEGDRVGIFPLIPCKKCEFCLRQEFAQCLKYDYYGSRRDGGFAEYLAVKEWNLFPIPEDISLEEASLLELLSVSVHAYRKLPLKGQDSIAIFGGGVIGLALAKFLVNDERVKEVFVIDRNKFKLDIAQKIGAQGIPISEVESWIEKRKAENSTIDHAIEACGVPSTYKHSLNIVKSHGSVLLVGNINDDLTLKMKEVSSILRRELKIFGCWNSRFQHSKDDDWCKALDFIRNSKGFFDLVSQKVSLHEGEKIFNALAAIKTRKDNSVKEQFLKVVFSFA